MLAHKSTLQDKIETLKKLHQDALIIITEEDDIEDKIVNESEFQAHIQESVIRVEQWLLKHDQNSKINKAREHCPSDRAVVPSFL